MVVMYVGMILVVNNNRVTFTSTFAVRFFAFSVSLYLTTASYAATPQYVYAASQLTVDPFAQKYPDTTDATLDANASIARFNRFGPYAGHYVAVGGLEGHVSIWDAETKGLIRVLMGHVRAVSSIRQVIQYLLRY